MGYKTESNKWTNKTDKQTTHRPRQQYGGYQREGGEEAVKMKGIKHVVMEGDLALGGEHTMQHTDDVF